VHRHAGLSGRRDRVGLICAITSPTVEVSQVITHTVWQVLAICFDVTHPRDVREQLHRYGLPVSYLSKHAVVLGFFEIDLKRRHNPQSSRNLPKFITFLLYFFSSVTTNHLLC
jgi:hypothetical protein